MGQITIKKGFQRQWVTKYLRVTLVFVWDSALREKFNFFFFFNLLLVSASFHFGVRRGAGLWAIVLWTLADTS